MTTYKNEQEYIERYDENGQNMYGLYKTRYYAMKAATNNEIVVKVTGGYKLMDGYQYQIWRKQK